MIAFYLRLSVADGDLGKEKKDESNSIENQRELLKNYLSKQDDMNEEIIEYIDDGYTGTNFDRPGFKNMIEDSKKGKISIILTKDLSRLGRDYIGVGDYLEQIFPVLGIRFVAVASNYDSNNYIGRTIGLDLTVTNLINNLYSRDISKKVSSALRSKWKQGICTTSRLPYGYRRDKEAKGTWGLDPETSGNVRLIFEKAMEGWNSGRIAAHLNELGILTPGMYREKKKEYPGKWKTPNKERIWDTEKVLTILNRYEYTGAFVNHYHQTIKPGSTQVRRVPIEDRYITEDAHVAIVTKEEYEKAQAVILILPKNIYRQSKKYLFKGKIRCGNCRLALRYQEREYNSYYYCHHKVTAGTYSKCCAEHYLEKELEYAVKDALDMYVALATQLTNDFLAQNEKMYSSVTNSAERIKQKIEILKAERIRQYEAFAEGVIEKEVYLKKKQELTKRIESLQNDNNKANIAMGEEQEVEDNLRHIGNLIYAYDIQKKLTREVVDAFIETIYVYNSKKVEVFFKYEDTLQKTQELLEEERMA